MISLTKPSLALFFLHKISFEVSEKLWTGYSYTAKPKLLNIMGRTIKAADSFTEKERRRHRWSSSRFQHGTGFPICCITMEDSVHYSNAASWSLVHLGRTVPMHHVVWQVIIADTGRSPSSFFFGRWKNSSWGFHPKGQTQGERKEWMGTWIYRISYYGLRIRAGQFRLAQIRHLLVPSKMLK